MQLNDAVHVHNRRAMHADKPHRIEPVRKLTQGGADEQFLAPNVQVDIDSGALDPVIIASREMLRYGKASDKAALVHSFAAWRHKWSSMLGKRGRSVSAIP